jgi:hypothetical protein
MLKVEHSPRNQWHYGAFLLDMLAERAEDSCLARHYPLNEEETNA